MRIFHELFNHIACFYLRRDKDSIVARWTAVLAVTLLQMFNLVSLIILIELIFKFKQIINITDLGTLLFFVGLVALNFYVFGRKWNPKKDIECGQTQRRNAALSGR